MEQITYSLYDSKSNSKEFYKRLTDFTDWWLAMVPLTISEMIQQYQTFICREKKEKLRSKEEYLLEFLALGIYWNLYSGNALRLPVIPEKILTKLSTLRRQGKMMKWISDPLRGILTTSYLSPFQFFESPSPNRENVEALLKWLSATGEYTYDWKRLYGWYQYLATLKETELINQMKYASELATQFEKKSEEMLGSYTSSVEKFLARAQSTYRYREDAIFCGRKSVEYHLNMLGAELMNRVFLQAFRKTDRKVVLLPGCMRIDGGKHCQAVPDFLGDRCISCSPRCNVAHLVRLGKEIGYDVYIIYHESALLSKGTAIRVQEEQIGIVGVACLLNLISGGWKLKEHDIPAQCILLDYCGCKQHWHKQGIPTKLDEDQLRSIIENSN